MKKSKKIEEICKSIKQNRYPLKTSWEHSKLKGNCYAYAIGSKYEEDSASSCEEEYIYNLGNIANLPYPETIEEAKRAFIADMNVLGITVEESDLKQKVRNGQWKIVFFFDENDKEHDFHFARQDKNRKWSNKCGIDGPITRLGRIPKHYPEYTLVGYYILEYNK